VAKSATRFIVTVDDIPSGDLVALGERGERWLEAHAPLAMHAKAVGQAMMFSRMSVSNIHSMLWSTAQATLLISVTLIFALRSLKLGVLSLVPNVLPALFTFGLWGALVGEINVAMSGVASISLGIVVDDTVHFMSKYLRYRRDHGLATVEALRETFADAGTSLVINTIVLVSGFLVLTLSSFGLNADMGLVTAIVLSIGVVSDILLLPALLLTFDWQATETSPVVLETSPSTDAAIISAEAAS
jgi:predicted RND superfamily exporter protein